MAGNIKEILEKIKKQQAQSLESESKEPEVSKPAKQNQYEENKTSKKETSEENSEKRVSSGTPSMNLQKEVTVSEKEESKEEEVSSEIAFLHNEGLFRRELLIKFGEMNTLINELNESMKVIAFSLAKLTGSD